MSDDSRNSQSVVYGPRPTAILKTKSASFALKNLIILQDYHAVMCFVTCVSRCPAIYIPNFMTLIPVGFPTCAFCRAEIKPEFLDHPVLIQQMSDDTKENEPDFQWYYRGERGIMKYQHTSTVSNLLSCLSSWTRSFTEREPVDVVYLDYEKAFDKVPTTRLLQKLEFVGIRGKLLNWIEAFLRHTFRVRIGETLSEEREILSGVPQGSVLGPVLYIIYTFDLPCSLHCRISTFADDTKIFANPLLEFDDDLNTIADCMYCCANGWWRYDERSNFELETAFNLRVSEFSLRLAGADYIVNFQTMVQMRKGDRTKRRKVRRAAPTLPAKACYDVPGIKLGISTNALL
ncbi:hypothetical protein MSG28_005157 [Choristoneura fumiferana]|uniref:Uncharacterized protein n=1 Tax=Choristoneura fumiferana TaxID=7141 RepID=A0ACC0JQC1_CHOFU|nr:hypothetical protein MSG28_005157 [Choristoneura fumiferana]